MDISKIGEILRIHTQRVKYNSGFAFYKNNCVSNNYANLNGSTATFYGSVYDEYHRKTYTAMVSINCKTRVISNMSCDCQTTSMNIETKICPHVVAVVLKGLEYLRNKNKKTFTKKDVVIIP